MATVSKKKKILSILELETLISKTNVINFNDWVAAASNPNLTSDLIDLMLDALKLLNGTKILEIKKLLSLHPNISEENMNKIILYSNGSNISILQNSKIGNKQLNLYFSTFVLIDDVYYSTMAFDRLMNSKNITQKLVKDWYNQLLKFADWSYQDNNWLFITHSFLNFVDLHTEALNDIVEHINKPQIRDLAVNHKNATAETKLIAFKVTKDIKYAPQEVIDIFMF